MKNILEKTIIGGAASCLLTNKRMLRAFIAVGALMCLVFGTTNGMARLCYLPAHLKELPSGEVGANDLITSTRFMRHMWVIDTEYNTPYDGFVATMNHGNQAPYGLWLHRVLGNATSPDWDDMIQISDDPGLVLDGIMDTTHSLDIVLSAVREEEFERNTVHHRLTHDSKTNTWELGEANTIFTGGAGRATIACELGSADPRLWCAVTTVDADTNIVQIKAYYSTDQGVTWNDSGQLFGSANTEHKKSGKILAFGDRVGLVFHDDDGVSTRTKWFAYHNNADDPLAAWTTVLIDTMDTPYDKKTWAHTHWSAAAGTDAKLHLAFQDKNSAWSDSGVRYAYADGTSELIEWFVTPMGSQVGDFPDNLGSYPQISVGSDNTPYIFLDHAFCVYATVFVNGAWMPFQQVAAKEATVCGKKRLTSPEQFCDVLPFAYQIYDCDNGTTGLEFCVARGCCQSCCEN